MWEYILSEITHLHSTVSHCDVLLRSQPIWAPTIDFQKSAEQNVAAKRARLRLLFFIARDWMSIIICEYTPLPLILLLQGIYSSFTPTTCSDKTKLQNVSGTTSIMFQNPCFWDWYCTHSCTIMWIAILTRTLKDSAVNEADLLPSVYSFWIAYPCYMSQQEFCATAFSLCWAAAKLSTIISR